MGSNGPALAVVCLIVVAVVILGSQLSVLVYSRSRSLSLSGAVCTACYIGALLVATLGVRACL